MEIKTKIEYGKLKKLIKKASKSYSIKVGLLATKAGENGKKGSDVVSENMDLAGVGMVQEFGATINVTPKMRSFLRHEFGVNLKKDTTQINIPPRSWLLYPLTKEAGRDLRKKLKAKISSVEEFSEYIAETGDLMSLAILLGASAIEQIQDAFDTEGFGQWLPNSAITIAKKGSSKPLIDKGALRGAITYDIRERK